MAREQGLYPQAHSTELLHECALLMLCYTVHPKLSIIIKKLLTYVPMANILLLFFFVFLRRFFRFKFITKELLLMQKNFLQNL